MCAGAVLAVCAAGLAPRLPFPNGDAPIRANGSEAVDAGVPAGGASGSAAKLKRTPLALGLTNVPPGEKASPMALSIAPAIAWPDVWLTTGAASACIARSFRLSAGVSTAWINAADVLATKFAVPA